VDTVLTLGPLRAGVLTAPPLMNVPAVSNTITGGAAVAASPGFSVRGRCSSQTLSLLSIAKLEASPSFHFGGTFGHALSTSNSGRLRDRDCASTTTGGFRRLRRNDEESDDNGSSHVCPSVFDE
jgi:hypothetical protein